MADLLMWSVVLAVAVLVVVVFVYNQKHRRELEAQERDYDAERDAVMESVGIAAVTEALHPTPTRKRVKVIRPAKKPAKKAIRKR